MDRWRYQYQRIADVLQQGLDKLTPDSHANHRKYRTVRADGTCSWCESARRVVDAAPPLTSEQRAALAALLVPTAEFVPTPSPRLRSIIKEGSK